MGAVALHSNGPFCEPDAAPAPCPIPAPAPPAPSPSGISYPLAVTAPPLAAATNCAAPAATCGDMPMRSSSTDSCSEDTLCVRASSGPMPSEQAAVQ